MCANLFPVVGPYDYHFRDIVPCSSTVCAQVCAQVRFHLPLLFKHFHSSHHRPYFVCQWGARGVIASTVDGKLVVHLSVHWMFCGFHLEFRCLCLSIFSIVSVSSGC